MKVFRILLCVVMGASGVALVARTFLGPLDSPVPIHSPLNAEGWFAVAALVLVVGRTPWSARDALVPLGPARGPAADQGVRPTVLAMVSLLVLIAAVFLRAANSYFLSDDFLIVRYANEYHFNFRQAFATAGGDGFFRPIGNLSLALTALWAQFDPLRWHTAEFALHAMNTMLVFALARQLGLARLGAWFAAAVFAVHGSRPEAAIWIAGRFDLLVTFFALLSLVLYLRSQTWLALAAMTLAILSKESGYAVPGLILLLPPRGGNRAKLSVPFFALAGTLLAYRWVLFGNVGGYLDAAGNPQAFVLNPVSVVETLAFRIWAILFFPINWSWQPAFVLGLAMVACLVALACARARQREMLFPLAFVVIASVPALQQLLIGADLEKARHLYLPSVGFALLLASVRPRPASLAVLAFQIAALWHNIDIWNYAASRTRPACAAAAACARESGRALVIGLPRTLNGVYFFANGFPACVESELGAPAQIEMRPTERLAEEAEGFACVLSWDSQ